MAVVGGLKGGKVKAGDVEAAGVALGVGGLKGGRVKAGVMAAAGMLVVAVGTKVAGGVVAWDDGAMKAWLAAVMAA